jgi:phosphatidylglycerophosphatase A
MPEPLKQDSPTEKSDTDSHSPAVLSPIVKIFASGLFSGYAPVASGTFGSLVGLLFYLIPSFERPEIILPSALFVFVFGSLAAGRMEKTYGHDPSVVTIDEVLGMWISLVFLPKSLLVIAGAFLLFRAFDIVKPWPARFFDRRHGGWNIMLDDVVAGIYANLLLQIAVRIL